MCRILEREGYRPVEAATGAEALAKVNGDLLAIVLDVKLPDMSGYEVCRRLKQNPRYSSIPIIQVSASFADPDHRAVGLSGGADAYIAQPVHPQELLNLVRSVIRSSQAEAMLRFMAQLGLKIARSLDVRETREAVQAALAPYFADRCDLVLRDADPTEEEPPPPPEPMLQGMVNEALQHGLVVMRVFAGKSSAIAAPLRSTGKVLGVVLFQLNNADRTYAESDVVFAGDLADRIALALHNAMLFTGQRAAQEALIQAEKLAAAGRLSAAIAHELNNPLEAITNLLFLIETDPDISATARNYAKEALSELERLSHITRQSLGFYRELTMAQEFNVSDNVQETLKLYARRLLAKQIRTVTDYDPELRVHAIRGEIRQVLSNLIVNAADAMDEGGTLRIQTFRSPAGEVVISVRDTGPGIPAEIERRIFEPFFTTKPGTGTGLGLWVSGTIMEKHGGRLECVTELEGEERGTTMRMVLPGSLGDGV